MATKVHRIRHYNPSPQSINCVSYNKVSKQVAVARSDASIEIWDLSYAPYLLKFIPGVENGSIEALGWVNNRLLSTGLGGALLEWDLDKLSVKTTVLLTGYAAWCLDVNPAQTLVAVGTEQGYVNLYSVEDNEIQYRKLFDKQEGRILCCKFDHTGGILVTGSVDTIRVWNVETGQALTRMSARRRGKETVVWCLAVLSDNTVVSGESGGRLTFWDITTGDQIESFTTHKADILSLVVVDGEKSLYCSGVDPIIVNFIKVVNKKEVLGGGSQWVKNVQRHIHEHDVRCLAMHENQLLSVGVDGYLTFSSFPPKWVMRIPPMLPQPRSSVSQLKKLVLLKYRNHLEVWKLGAYATNLSGSILTSNVNLGNQHKKTDNTNDSLEADSDVATTNRANVYQGKAETLKLTECPLKLVSVQTKAKKQIRCAELSPNGEFIAYSTDSDIRILKLEMDDEANTTSLSKVLVHGLAAEFCDRMAFTHDSQSLVLHCTGVIYVLQVDAGAGATVTLTLPTDQYKLSPTLLHLVVSAPCPSRAAYLAAADTAGQVHVWSRTGMSTFESHAALPKYHCVPSAVTVDSANERLILVYVDQTLMEYSLANKKFSDWPRHELPPVWFRTHAARAGALPHPRRAGALVLHDETALWLLDRTLQNGSGDPSDAKKKPNRQHNSKNASVRIIPTKYLADFHWVGDDEAVMVEVLPQNIIAQLPPVANIRNK